MTARQFTTNDQGFNRAVSRPDPPLPPRACDTHMHIVGPYPRFPLLETRSLTPPEATWEDYDGTMAALGLGRCVIVQPSVFADDNACTLDAVAHSRGRARAVVVVAEDIDPAELNRLHAAGARGLRLQALVKGGTAIEAIRTLARKAAPLGWHIQLYLDSRQLPDLAPTLTGLEVPIVFDHMAHVARDEGPDEPGFQQVLRLVGEGHAWVKLCNPEGPASAEHARRLVSANPERVLWGSDWPHLVWAGSPPDDSDLITALRAWAPDEETVTRILVDNPDRLYFS